MHIYSVISSVIIYTYIYIYIYIYIVIGKKEKKRRIGNVNLNQPNLHKNSLKLSNHGSSLGKKKFQQRNFCQGSRNPVRERNV